MTSSENLVSAKLDLIFNNVSKVFVIFGCLLFFSITLGVSLSYRTDVVSVIIGYHLCFLILAVGLAIRYAYNPGKKKIWVNHTMDVGTGRINMCILIQNRAIQIELPHLIKGISKLEVNDFVVFMKCVNNLAALAHF